jgi:hypothetical protein
VVVDMGLSLSVALVAAPYRWRDVRRDVTM